MKHEKCLAVQGHTDSRPLSFALACLLLWQLSMDVKGNAADQSPLNASNLQMDMQQDCARLCFRGGTTAAPCSMSFCALKPAWL